MSSPAGPPPNQGAPPPGAPAVCVRHPDRTTLLSCTRCGRPACPECLREAAVGFQCVDCVGAAAARAPRRGVTVAGAEPVERPIVVPALIVLNVAAFVWTVVQAGSIAGNADSALFYSWAMAPRLIAAGEWWRLVTSGFLHIGLLHIAFNMLALWVLGRELERVLGRGRFLAVYLVSMLGGAAAVMVASPPNQFVAGASGAVFGLMGGLVVVLRRLRLPLGQVVGLLVVNLAIALFPGTQISLVAHIGGLLVGAAATAALVYAPVRNRNTVQAVALGALTVVVLAVITLTAVAL